MGLIICLILSDPNDDSTLYSDHLNATRLIDDSKTAVDQQTHLRGMNGRSYYRWILRLVADNPLKIVYTPGHSSEVTVPARLNHEADHYASSAQRHLDEVFTAPTPTFYMDEFTFHTRDDGWIESSIRNYVEKSQILNASKHHSAINTEWRSIYTTSPPPPEYSYTMAYSAYSAVVQLYARSGQLPTAEILHSRGKIDDERCRAGCDAIEDQHHIFVVCERYAEWREKAAEDLYRRTNNKLAEKGIEEVNRSLFSDNKSIWPLHYSTYYLGHLPKIEPHLPRKIGENGDRVVRTRLAHHLASDWHTAAIRLAGRIWGDWQREMAKANDARGR
ncbi:hypothetical protein FB451DRAFT_1271046 [Mycena latifolia]|nr:hypothetical protein FB451DRAFT_1271046 [Mycena latifolia]